MTVVTASFHGKSYSLIDNGGKQCDLIRRGSVYEASLLEWVYEQKLTGIAIDAGANIGNHSLWFSEICGMHVIAYEPLETAALVRNVALNKASSRVEVWPYGLDAGSGWALPAGKMTLQGTDGGLGTIRVVTLDSQMRASRRVSLIKIDVEGMEVDVVRGSLQTIERWKPILLVEEWEASTTEAVRELLYPLGHRRTRGFGGRGRAPMGCYQWVGE